MAETAFKENLDTNLPTQPVQQDDQLKTRKRITKEFLKKLLRSDIKQYYCTPALNDILYLHYKGFDAIENLEEFTELKVLYLEGNCISKIENLANKDKVRALYLQENLINKIENVEYLDSLITLNLNDNFIMTIENLEKNVELESLQLKRNKIGVNGLSDILHLSRLKRLCSLDISNNFIDGESDDFLSILESCQSLAVLYLFGNPICNKISNYRKTLIAKLKNLKYLDDRPVFPEDRIFAEAFYFHGIEAERKAREDWKKQEEEKHWRNHQAFKEMLFANRQRNQAQEHVAHPDQNSSINESTNTNREESAHTSNLETYYTKTEETSGILKDSSEANHDNSIQESEKDSDLNLNDSLSVSNSVKETRSETNDLDALD